MTLYKKVSLFILFCIILMVFFAWTKLNQQPPALTEKEKKEALKNILGRDVREEKNSSQGELAYPGRYFSLSYPAYAQVYDRENTNITSNKDILEHFRLDSEEPKFKFMVMIEKAQDGGALDELSAVKVKHLNKQYSESQTTIDGSNGIQFIKTKDGVERSSFFLKSGRAYSFVITGVDAVELEKIYGQIMQSVMLLK